RHSVASHSMEAQGSSFRSRSWTKQATRQIFRLSRSTWRWLGASPITRQACRAWRCSDHKVLRIDILGLPRLRRCPDIRASGRATHPRAHEKGAAGMRRYRITPRNLATIALPLLLPALMSLPSEAATTSVTCVNPGDLQAAVNAAAPFDTLNVSGLCSETELTIRSDKNGLILDGGDSAIIQDPEPG